MASDNLETLLLVDYENVHKVDFSVLVDGVRAVIFVGAKQEVAKAIRSRQGTPEFKRLDFVKVDRTGKNALDFHIACRLGQVFEAAPSTHCVVISRDKGFDAVISHLSGKGMPCRRVDSWAALVAEETAAEVVAATLSPTLPPERAREVEPIQCPHCKKSDTVEHHGGRWCANCGKFAVAPDPSLLPSSRAEIQARERERMREAQTWGRPRIFRAAGSIAISARLPECGWCHQRVEMDGGIFDEGEWMCSGCVDRLATY